MDGRKWEEKWIKIRWKSVKKGNQDKGNEIYLEIKGKNRLENM